MFMQMKQQNKTWQLSFYAFLFLAMVLVLFFSYTIQNQARIQEQNKVYAKDCARQTADRIAGKFDNALQRIQNSAYLVSTESGTVQVDTKMLKTLEANTTFDATVRTGTILFVGCGGRAELKPWQNLGLPGSP